MEFNRPRQVQKSTLLLADQISTTFGTHSGRVNALRGHVKPLAGLERPGLAFRGDGHLALEDDVGGDIRVGVVRIAEESHAVTCVSYELRMGNRARAHLDSE